jgi:transposase
VNAENTCRRCLSLVGLAGVVVLEVEDHPGVPLRVHVELEETPQGGGGCGVVAHVKDRRRVELVDLPAFGRPARLIWVKRRFRCPEPTCSVGSWTEEAPEIAPRRLKMTDRAGRWITEQVGRCARSVSEVARELGCDWHTVNDAVIAYGEALVDDDPHRFGTVAALGLDEVLFVRLGRFHAQHFSTSVNAG